MPSLSVRENQVGEITLTPDICAVISDKVSFPSFEDTWCQTSVTFPSIVIDGYSCAGISVVTFSVVGSAIRPDFT